MSLQIDRKASQRKLTITSSSVEGDTKLALISEIAEVLSENLSTTKYVSTTSIFDKVTFDKNSLKECLKEAYINILNSTDASINVEEVKEKKVKTIDDIYNPTYYNKNGLSPIEAFKMGLLSQEEYIGFLKGNIIKYSVRCDSKNREEDMEKCKTYAEYLREELKGEK